MRNLTIKRAKRFVGCLGKMKVYIEDAAASEITINGTPCRKLGILKNGGEETFTIEERAAKVYVIGDKLSKDMCNDFYQLPEGAEDIVLTGKNIYNPTIGNPFIFDGNENEEVKKNRKKNKTRGIVFILICAAIGFAIGLFSGLMSEDTAESRPKDFSVAGLNITLTEGFREVKQEGFPACFESSEVAVISVKEDFASAEGLSELTVQKYGEFIMDNNSYDHMRMYSEGDRTYIEYETEPVDETYFYFLSIYKTDDAFWMVNFAVPVGKKAEYIDTFKEWANTVSFN